MTQEEARTAAEVMMAYSNGKKVEGRRIGRAEWRDIILPVFDWWRCEYRVKPKQEKFDPKTLQPFDRVLVRDNEEGRWVCSFYSHDREYEDTLYRYMSTNNAYKYCIPYNDDTKHLVGTSKEAPEYYRYWED